MDLDNIKVRINKPYPKIVGASVDPMTVNIIKSLASSRLGELTAILEYTYQSVIADKSKEDIGGIFEEIAIVEMTHLDMLMHAITEFGGIPKYEDGAGNIFTSNYINYNTKLKDMLDNNIIAEQRAIEQYRESILRVKNQSLKELFSRIIEDEEQHIKVFKYLKDSVEFLSL